MFNDVSLAELLSFNYSMDVEKIASFYYFIFKSDPVIANLKAVFGIIPRLVVKFVILEF